MKEQQRNPTAIKIVQRTKKTKRGEWVSLKVRDLVEDFYRLRDDVSSQGQEPSAASDNAIFLEILAGKIRRAMYLTSVSLGISSWPYQRQADILILVPTQMSERLS